MLTTSEKVLRLRGVDLFLALTAEDLVEIAEIAEEVDFGAGEMIIREGEVGVDLYVVVDGAVRVFRGEHQLAVLGLDSVFGEIAILDSEPRTASVAADTDVSLLRIHQQDFVDILRSRPQIANAVIRVLCERLRNENRAKK